jgi:hypothetical protein
MEAHAENRDLRAMVDPGCRGHDAHVIEIDNMKRYGAEFARAGARRRG